ACLSPDERERAARYRTPELTRRFIAGRTLLRRTLARYLDCAADSLGFTYNPYGRPSLASAPFDFNLSHSGSAALIAVARETVGVDIEHRAPDADLAGMARQVMSPIELRQFEALSSEDTRVAAFYDLWTAKEAVIKALGTGFSRDPSTLHIGWNEPLDLIDAGLRYHVRRVSFGDSVPAAIALAGKIVAIHHRL
ncbi:MAG: 4'-phosphopantetheinyl transferase superfamily protein, partial [Caulobacteraceae bacterium]